MSPVNDVQRMTPSSGLDLAPIPGTASVSPENRLGNIPRPDGWRPLARAYIHHTLLVWPWSHPAAHRVATCGVSPPSSLATVNTVPQVQCAYSTYLCVEEKMTMSARDSAGRIAHKYRFTPPGRLVKMSNSAKHHVAFEFENYR